MKSQKSNRTKRTNKSSRNQRNRNGSTGFEALEPRKMLAGDLGVYADLDMTTDWAGEFVGETGTTDRGYDVAIQQDQKIVVAGVVAKTIQQASQDLMVARYNSDGSIDASFNNGAGFNSVDFGTIFRDIGQDVAIQNDGKIVVAGTGYDYGEGLAEHLIAARFNADGSFNASYTDQPFDYQWTSDVLAHSNGKTYIIGVAKDGGKNELLLTRLNADFTLDTSFASGGLILHDYASSLDLANTGAAMVEQSDGKIVISGIADRQGYFARLNEDGSFDTSYASGGEGVIDTHTSETGGGGRNRFDNVVLDSLGNAYFSGISDVTADASDVEVVIVKIDNTGALVNSFGNGGIFRYNPTSGTEDGVADLDQSGNLILSGNSSGLGGGFLAWVNSDGTLDQEYVAQRGGELRGLVIDVSNRAVVSGESANATLDTWLLRVNPNVEFADSFESGQWNGLWVEDSQNDWFTSTQRSTDGNYSAEVDGRATDATLTVANSIDMSDYGIAELTFDWYIESGFDSGEYLKLEFWDGSSWSENVILSLNGNVDQENVWHNEVVQLDPQYLNADFKFRYLAKVSRSNEDANVDNVQLLGTSLAVPPNTAPIASADAYTMNEDNTLAVGAGLGVLANDSDGDGDPITALLVNNPANGSVTLNADGSFNYTPDPNFNGSDSFTYVAFDDIENSNIATVNITVDQIDDLGIFAGDLASTTDEDALANGTATYFDAADGFSTPTFTVSTAASNGVASIDANGNWSYTPVLNFYGSDRFAISVTDDDGNAQSQAVNINITPVADLNAIDDNFNVDEDGTLGGDVSTNDSTTSGGTLSFVIDNGPGSGSLTLNPDGSLSFTPTGNFNGSDSFVVSVTDDDGNVETQVVNITITPVADLTAINDNFNTNEDGSLVGNVADNDSTTSGGTLSFAVDGGPASGSLSLGSDGSFTYTPNTDFNGNDSFSYTVTDGSANEVDTRTVSITIDQVNDAGLFAGDLTATIDENTTATGTATFSDTADSFIAANFTLASPTTNGVATIDSAGNWSYTPAAAFFGTDNFTVSVTDDDGNVESQLISITVNEITQLTANDDFYNVDEDGSFGGDVSTNDSTTSGGTLSFILDSGPASGLLSVFNNDGSFTYTPNADFNGNDSFTYTVSDAAANESDTRTVNITVNQLNDPGLFGGNLSATTNEDISIGGTATFSDTADGFTTANFTVSNAASSGVASIDAAGNWSYSPNANYNGSDSFTVSVTDDDGNVETQLVSVTITAIVDLTANDDALGGNEDSLMSGNVESNDSTTSGGTLGFVLDSGPSNGALGLNSDGSFTYTPNANFNGNDSFTYTVTDPSSGESDTRLVSITVNPVNDAPVATADADYTLDQDTAMNVSAPGILTNDTDVDGDSLTVVWVSDPTNGTLALNTNGSFDYTPNPGYFGSDSFQYMANDGAENSSPVTVSITVNEVVVNSGPNLAHGTVANVGSAGWTTINLGSSYTSMVVVATGNYDNSSVPGVVRIQNAIGSSFDVRVDVPGGGSISGVSVHYIVMEEGVYNEAGFKLEAVKFDSTVTDQNNSWNGESRSYQQSYIAPVVVGQVMSYNDLDWSVFWAAGGSRTSAPSSSVLTVGKHVGEDADVTRAPETIGYFVIETTTTGVIEGLPIVAGVGSDNVRGIDNVTSSNGYQYNYNVSFNSKTAVVSQAGMDGGDGGWAVLYGSAPVSPYSSLINVAVDEDQIANSERKHTTEQIAYFIIDPPELRSAELTGSWSDRRPDDKTSVSLDWQTLGLRALPTVATRAPDSPRVRDSFPKNTPHKTVPAEQPQMRQQSLDHFWSQIENRIDSAETEST